MNLIKDLILATKEPETHVKDSFWASETETNVFDIYHRWKGTPVTNPIDEQRIMVMTAGKMFEEAIIQKLETVRKIEKQVRVEMEREGVKVTGYIDAMVEGLPVELKSFYGVYQLEELRNRKPRESYLKQLAIYMDFTGTKEGRLLYVERGTGELIEFTLAREGTKFSCFDVHFDITDTYKKWSRLYKENIIPGIEPSPWEERYKIPIGEIDWSKVSKSDISKARNNQKVIGDGWKISYSPYKNLILERQGTAAGYSPDELEQIKISTKGYTSKK